jgi:uncharacterized membrane protein YphA (DoxX/SURF4 family)
MNTLLWVLQGIVAAVFLFSGINKSYFSEKTLVEKGQTGVEGLPLWLIRFIGISEILGATGLILPYLLNIYPQLTAVSAVCLGAIMLPAAVIHYKRSEPKNVLTNVIVFIICVVIAWFRLD